MRLARFTPLCAALTFASTAALASAATTVPMRHPIATATATPRPLAVNETAGYGADRLLTFRYQQQFDCVDGAYEDRNYNGKVAAEDPAEFYGPPPCQIGFPSLFAPTGMPVANTDKLWVLVPFFETDPTQPAFTSGLGQELKKLFGFVPDAFKIHPGVPVQCPEPGLPYTQIHGAPGTCTMHPLQQDLGPVLSALHLIPPKTIVDTPLVNHSHLLANTTILQSPEWWQVIVVLVKDPKSWPDRCGCHGITSLAKLRAAQSKNLASPDVASNFFLFFSSATMSTMSGMNGMPRM